MMMNMQIITCYRQYMPCDTLWTVRLTFNPFIGLGRGRNTVCGVLPFLQYTETGPMSEEINPIAVLMKCHSRGNMAEICVAAAKLL